MQSIVDIAERVALTGYFTQTVLQVCLDALVSASQDYSVDKRGDTGRCVCK